jgi:hypothetical protein
METILSILLQIGELVGVAAAIAAIINVLKTFGLVKDGQAGAWSAALNLIALAVLVGLKLYRPDLDLKEVDVQVGAFASIIGLVLSLVVQIKSASVVHTLLAYEAHIPVIGKSFTLDEIRA